MECWNGALAAVLPLLLGQIRFDALQRLVDLQPRAVGLLLAAVAASQVLRDDGHRPAAESPDVWYFLEGHNALDEGEPRLRSEAVQLPGCASGEGLDLEVRGQPPGVTSLPAEAMRPFLQLPVSRDGMSSQS